MQVNNKNLLSNRNIFFIQIVQLVIVSFFIDKPMLIFKLLKLSHINHPYDDYFVICFNLLILFFSTIALIRNKFNLYSFFIILFNLPYLWLTLFVIEGYLGKPEY